MTNKGRIGPRARGKSQSIQDDRLAGSGFASERRQTRPEGEIQALDQHDVADGQADQHGR
jgi:hypothetical protein